MPIEDDGLALYAGAAMHVGCARPRVWFRDRDAHQQIAGGRARQQRALLLLVAEMSDYLDRADHGVEHYLGGVGAALCKLLDDNDRLGRPSSAAAVFARHR